MEVLRNPGSSGGPFPLPTLNLGVVPAMMTPCPHPDDAVVLDVNTVVGRMDVLFVTLDCLRLDVARACLQQGRTPNLAAVLPREGWEARETPGTFTLPAHLAFFHGFLPTPLTAGPHARLFALEFEGSLS